MSKKIDPYDRSLKVMARHYPQIFFSLLIDPAKEMEIMVDNPEINLPEKRSDYVWRVKDGEQEGYFNFEFQLKPDREALKSAYTKCALLHEATGLPVIGVILYITRGACREEYEIELFGIKNHYHFRIIRLWEYKEEIESGKRKELAPFLVLFADHPDEEVLRKEKELIMQIDDEKERADLLSIAMTLAFHYFQESWVKEYFKEEMQMIKTANVVQEWIDEGIQQGVQQGIQQGVQQSIIEVLEERFDLVPAVIIQSLKKVDEPAILHRLLRKAAKIASLDEFKEILKILTP
jgi:predicted transposase/invertase (TIGR01784 family)